MDCQHCQGRTKKFGRTKDGRQRFRCLACRKISAEHKAKPQRGRRPPPERVLMILNLLCEGVSIRAAQRITGTERRPILRLLARVGGGARSSSLRRSRAWRSRTLKPTNFGPMFFVSKR
jgi:transposase-like protein